jgi:hypothetical protein
MRITKEGMFSEVGNGTAALTIGAQSGQIKCTQMHYDTNAAGTIKFYRARTSGRANADVAAVAAVVIKTDSEGHVGGEGAVIDGGDVDFIIVENSTQGGTNYYFASVTTVAAVDDATVALTLSAVITCLEGDKLYLVKASDIVSRVCADELVHHLYDAFSGYANQPIHILVTAAGDNTISGEYVVQN